MKAETLRAEGEKQVVVLEAEGRKEAAFRIAEAPEREAEAKATDLVSQAISRAELNAENYFVVQKYVEALQQIGTTQNHKLVLIPLAASSIIGAIGGITELAKTTLDEEECDLMMGSEWPIIYWY